MSNTKVDPETADCIWCIRGLRQICDHDAPVDENIISFTEPENLPTKYKTDASLKDQQSTGRKRAAALYPLEKTMFCEWAGLEKAGGGSYPIQGCGRREDTEPGYQTHRHHGPDKNTLNNELGNVHRICTSCHNTWHAANDSSYTVGGKIESD